MLMFFKMQIHKPYPAPPTVTRRDGRGLAMLWRLALVALCVNLGGCLYITDNGLTFFKPYYTKRDREVSQADIQVLDGALKLLQDKSVGWNRNDDRLCICGETWSLFCALARASIDVTGEYQHRRVAIQEVRFTINDNFPDRWKRHQLQDFNNHEDTRFEDVIWVLQETRNRLLKRLNRSDTAHEGATDSKENKSLTQP